MIGHLIPHAYTSVWSWHRDRWCDMVRSSRTEAACWWYQQNCVGSSSTSRRIKPSSHLMPFRIHTVLYPGVAKPTPPWWGQAGWHRLDGLVMALGLFLGSSHCCRAWSASCMNFVLFCIWPLLLIARAHTVYTVHGCGSSRNVRSTCTELDLCAASLLLYTVCDTVSVGAVRFSFWYITRATNVLSFSGLYASLPPENFFRPRERRSEHRS
jgi:hypothetical protein